MRPEAFLLEAGETLPPCEEKRPVVLHSCCCRGVSPRAAAVTARSCPTHCTGGTEPPGSPRCLGGRSQCGNTQGQRTHHPQTGYLFLALGADIPALPPFPLCRRINPRVTSPSTLLKVPGSVKSGLSLNLQIVSISLELLFPVNGGFTPVPQSPQSG